MHTIQVFVLRLFVDSENPQVLRGAVRSVPDGETHPFRDEQALLALLRRMISPAAALPPAENGQEGD
jgi:hypothetical protein